MKKLMLLFTIIFLSLPTLALEDVYPFTDPLQAMRFKEITSELRCLVCQNQNLAESNAPLAKDLREQIFHKIIQGEDNQAIRHYLVARYGNFILYRPPFTTLTLLLWIGPFLLLGLSVVSVLYYLIKTSGSCELNKKV